MVMVMPPYHGATIRVDEAGHLRLLPRGLRRDRHPDHDPGRAGQRHAAARRRSWPAWRARSSSVAYFKIEMPRRRGKLRELIAARRRRDRRPLGRRGGDHAAARPRRRRDRRDDRRRLSRRHRAGSSMPTSAGDRDAAVAAYERWLPLINYENRQCGLLRRQGADEGRRRHRLRSAAPSVRAAAPRDPRRPARARRAGSTRWCCAGRGEWTPSREAATRARLIFPQPDGRVCALCDQGPKPCRSKPASRAL